MFDIVPTLDHVVVNARDQLDEAAAAYERLGFTLTPRGHHTLGSANHLAVFGTHYLELIGVLSADSQRRDILSFPAGLNGLVFGTENATATHAALTAAGIDATPPKEFSRPVAVPGGPRDAVFRTVHVTPTPIWPGRIYFCQHFNRDLVWRDEWRHHANGTAGVVRTLIASDDPMRLGYTFGRIFGHGALRPVEGGVSLIIGLSRVDVLTHATVATQLGDAGTSDDRPEYMAALTLRTRSLTQAATALRKIPIREEPARLTVPADFAFGCAIEFVE